MFIFHKLAHTNKINFLAEFAVVKSICKMKTKTIAIRSESQSMANLITQRRRTTIEKSKKNLHNLRNSYKGIIEIETAVNRTALAVES